MRSSQLTEKYRPMDWPEVKGQDAAIALLQDIEARGELAGQAYFITGKTGVGKTTIARIIARKCADKWHTEEVDAGEVTVSRLADWTETQHYRPISGPGRAYIVNEAHGLRKDPVRRLLTFLENLAPYTTVIFTTTLQGQMQFEEDHMDSGPLTGRCVPIRLTNQGLNPAFTALVMKIAQAEGLPTNDAVKNRVARAIKEAENSCRAGINALSGAIKGEGE